MNLAEAVKLKSILKAKFHEYTSELHRSAFITTEKNQAIVTSNRTMEEIHNDLNRVRKDIRTLDRLVYEANVANTVSFEDEQLTLVEAIEFASQLRESAASYRMFGENEKEEIQHGYGDTVLYRIAQFDPALYREKAEQLEKQAHRLSNAINAKNYSITIAFDDSKYF